MCTRFRRWSLFALCLLVFSAVGSRAVDGPAPGIPLWPEGVPGLKADAAPEHEDNGRFTHIHYPSLVRYDPPAGTANGCAVIVAPGGGYMRIVIDKEGPDTSAWLNRIGVTASGAAALPNGQDGILLDSGTGSITNVTIGGTAAEGWRSRP